MNYRELYQQQGFLAPIDIIDEKAAAHHRAQLERAEKQIGAIHYLAKIHTVLTSAASLAGNSEILDVVEQCIGPDILVNNVTYIIKEAHSESHVSWHQDLTYWGLDSDDQISVWLALSPANEHSGCMRMIPGSHVQGKRDHILGEFDQHNVLHQNQRVADIDESLAIHAELKPGQASFHHGWLLHDSRPNSSDDRRIGLNVQYIAPHVRQVKQPGSTAWLVRGVDRYNYHIPEQPAQSDLDPEALLDRAQKERLYLSVTATQ